MIRKRNVNMLLVCSGVAVGMAAAALAGPMLEVNDPHKLPEDVMSLAGIKKLGVKVQPLGTVLEDLGLRAHDVREIWISRLENADFELVDSPGQPYLSLAVHTGNIQGEGGQRAFGIQVKFFQPLPFKRLDRTLNVPTYVTGGFGMAGSEVLRTRIEEILDVRIDVFIKLVNYASEHANREDDPILP